jgi:arabinogalactan endo-1,4-beta-galactosidase
MPFLEENEWQEVEPLLNDAIRAIKDYRETHNCDLITARENCKPAAMLKFEEITGVSVHYDMIYHHRLKDWGSECKSCGNLYRTPKAKHCAHCSFIES